MTWAVTNHLWQSTLFAIAAGLLTLVFRKGRARVRYGLWFSASCKFFIPFSLLTALGNHIGWMPAARTPAVPYVLFKVDQITQPFPEALRSTPSGPGTATDWLFVVIITAWICGFSAIVVARFRDWLHLRFPELESKAGNYGVWGGLVPGFADASARQVFGAYHGKTFTGKLRPLIAVEDFRPTLSQCLSGSRRLVNKNQNPTSSEINLSQAKNGLDNGVHLTPSGRVGAFFVADLI